MGARSSLRIWGREIADSIRRWTCAERLRGFAETVRDRVAGAPVKHMDETGFIAGQPGHDRAPIVAHPDVKRMLLSMRALTNAARAICYTTAVAIDRARSAGRGSITSVLISSSTASVFISATRSGSGGACGSSRINPPLRRSRRRSALSKTLNGVMLASEPRPFANPRLKSCLITNEPDRRVRPTSHQAGVASGKQPWTNGPSDSR